MALPFSLSLASALTFLLSLTTALPYYEPRTTIIFPPLFLLAGDSTTHSGSGWGDGFLNKTLRSPASGINHGVSGASIPSYRAGGYWTTVLNQIESYKTTREVLVTIQFGHNDQKVPAYEAAFAANLKQLVLDVENAGGIPIIVTPLSRRTFSGCCIVQDLANETAKGLAVAQKTGSRVINLNKASTTYLNAIGPAAAHRYNLAPNDYTHLNLWGSVVFGRLVSDLLVAKYEDVKAYTVANATLSAELAAGKPA